MMKEVLQASSLFAGLRPDTKLKVIGGAHDGEFHEVNGNSVELCKFLPVEMAYGDPISPVAGNVERVAYTVRQLACKLPDGSIDKFHFLSPHWMSDMEAIKHQFRK